MEAHGIKNIKADHAASHLGKAHGIVTLLRSIPYHTQKRVIVLPEDILMKYNVSSETVLRNIRSTALNDVIFEIASCAKQHVDEVLCLYYIFSHNDIVKYIFLIIFSGDLT